MPAVVRIREDEGGAIMIECVNATPPPTAAAAAAVDGDAIASPATLGHAKEAGEEEEGTSAIMAQIRDDDDEGKKTERRRQRFGGGVAVSSSPSTPTAEEEGGMTGRGLRSGGEGCARSWRHGADNRKNEGVGGEGPSSPLLLQDMPHAILTTGRAPPSVANESAASRRRPHLLPSSAMGTATTPDADADAAVDAMDHSGSSFSPCDSPLPSLLLLLLLSCASVSAAFLPGAIVANAAAGEAARGGDAPVISAAAQPSTYYACALEMGLSVARQLSTVTHLSPRHHLLPTTSADQILSILDSTMSETSSSSSPRQHLRKSHSFSSFSSSEVAEKQQKNYLEETPVDADPTGVYSPLKVALRQQEAGNKKVSLDKKLLSD